MSGITSFFRWWFSELGAVFSGKAAPQLVLSLSDTEIALSERGYSRPLGVVATNAPDREERIESLRAIAERNVGHPAPVEIRLPPEQTSLIEGSFQAANEEDLRAQAIRFAQTEWGIEDALAVDLAITGRDGAAGGSRALVAAALQLTVDEALGYARDWGFNPLRVTSAETASAFPEGPSFYDAPTAQRSGNLPKIAAALACAAILITGAAAARLLHERSLAVETLARQVAATPAPEADLVAREQGLVRFAHSAAMAFEERIDHPPVWQIVERLSATLPGDTSVGRMVLRQNLLTIEGVTGSVPRVVDALQASTSFGEPSIVDTEKASGGAARFIIDVSVEQASAGGVL